ncbi:sensor histidine kinase [Phytohabitans flavus]
MKARRDRCWISGDEVRLRFYQAGDSRSRAGGGGLAIVASVVAAHRGQVSATATPGGGATFRVALPVDGEVGGRLSWPAARPAPAKAKLAEASRSWPPSQLIDSGPGHPRRRSWRGRQLVGGAPGARRGFRVCPRWRNWRGDIHRQAFGRL